MHMIEGSIISKLREDCLCQVMVQDTSVRCKDAHTAMVWTLLVFSSDSGSETATKLANTFSYRVSLSAVALDLNGSEVLITSACHDEQNSNGRNAFACADNQECGIYRSARFYGAHISAFCGGVLLSAVFITTVVAV